MDKIKNYVNSMVEDGNKVMADLNNYFVQFDFEDFLTLKAERYFKQYEVVSFFTNLKLSIDNNAVTKEELIINLETIRKGYEKTRLTKNPINFSTNPMTNMVRLWHFEVYAELIKHIDIMLNRYL